ncbi:SH3 domain-containing protein [Paracoccus halophilus]|nr:SH3 domain-containing protein [Paracoccus halophilus]SFA60594.1 SH3 domain-containing protein [Paracoccus halophilus]
MRTHFAALLAFMVATGCAIASDVVVKGAGPDDLLKLREGPGLSHKIIIGLPNGTRLTRQNCVTNDSNLWCRVSLADRPGISGYVWADYLAPR